MSSTQPPHEGHAPDSPSDVRALPARPNLEFERKQAKKLLAQLRRGNREAFNRAHAKLKGSRDTKPHEFKLADAQFTIAREYGFTSWPTLVEYFETLTRHEISGASRVEESSQQPEMTAQSILRQHQRKLPWAAAALTSFVPRFLGRTADEVLASDVNIDDARLAVARMHRYPSWEALLANVVPRNIWEHDDSPRAQTWRAVRERNVDEFKRLITAHPELLEVSSTGSSITNSVVQGELRSPDSESRELTEWLATHVDIVPALNWLLLGYIRMKTSDMRWLLARGADPEWVPPNGISVLEHAIYRCQNGEAVDLIARRVKPRKALWIAAGIGDAEAVARYVNKDGTPTDAARRYRPDFTAMGPFPMVPNFGPGDHEVIGEAFILAGWNDRLAVLDVLLDRGFPVDYAPWGQPLLHLGIFEARVPLVEFLVRRGAKVDDRAREAAEEMMLNPHFVRPGAHRVLEICGGRPLEVLRRERDERHAKRVMPTSPIVEEAFEFAKRDAVQAGLKAVSPENLFIGLLRRVTLVAGLLQNAGVDLPRLKSIIGVRFEAQAEAPAEMTSDEECTTILMAARAEAERRKAERLDPLHIMHALIRHAPHSVMEMIHTAGGSGSKILAVFESVMGAS